jgi:hypothetical protein
MNRIFGSVVLLCGLLIGSQVLLSQQISSDDKVVQKDGKEILCKVLSIDTSYVKIDPQGPISLKLIALDQIEYISFAKGEILKFPLPMDYKFITETSEYDNPVSVKKTATQPSIISFFYGPYHGDNTDPLYGIQTRFDNSNIFGMKVSIYYPELSPGTIGYNVVLSFAKYSVSSLLYGDFEELMNGTAINLDMSGEFLLFDVSKLYIPNPYIMAGFGITRFFGDEVSELKFSINYGSGIRLLFTDNFGLGFTIKHRPVWVKDMGSPNFVEMSGELFFQAAIPK